MNPGDEIKSWIGYYKSLTYQKLIRPVFTLAAKIPYPGEEKISFMDITRFFILGIQKGDIQTRARSISFEFFLAIFPTIIFFFTLIPYIPLEGFQERILVLLQEVLPASTFEATRTTIEDILLQPRGGLLSFGFLFALYISTNGIYSMIESFNQSYHGIEIRTKFKQRLVSIFLTMLLAVIVVFSIALIIATEIASAYLEKKNFFNAGTQIFLIQAGKWIILVGMSLAAISSLYFYGPSKKNKRPFISVGSVMATVLLILTSIAFNYFISNFAQYNKIYGSIGTLIVILVWIYFNSLQLLIGFELNASIENALSRAGKSVKIKTAKEGDIQRSI